MEYIINLNVLLFACNKAERLDLSKKNLPTLNPNNINSIMESISFQNILYMEPISQKLT